MKIAILKKLRELRGGVSKRGVGVNFKIADYFAIRILCCLFKANKPL